MSGQKSLTHEISAPRNRSHKSAFTIVEMLIVISIIAVFSVVATVNYNRTQRSIEFGNVYLQITEMLREARNLAINSKVDNRLSNPRPPHAYSVNFDARTPYVITQFLDAYKDAETKMPYSLDPTSNGDLILQEYTLPDQYTLTLSFKKNIKDSSYSLSANQMASVGFMPPFGDVYLTDDPGATKNPDLQKKIEIKITQTLTGGTRYICINAIGSVIQESLNPCQ